MSVLIVIFCPHLQPIPTMSKSLRNTKSPAGAFRTSAEHSPQAAVGCVCVCVTKSNRRLSTCNWHFENKYRTCVASGLPTDSAVAWRCDRRHAGWKPFARCLFGGQVNYVRGRPSFRSTHSGERLRSVFTILTTTLPRNAVKIAMSAPT